MPTTQLYERALQQPHVLAEEIAEDLRDALGQIEGVLADLKARVHEEGGS